MSELEENGTKLCDVIEHPKSLHKETKKAHGRKKSWSSEQTELLQTVRSEKESKEIVGLMENAEFDVSYLNGSTPNEPTVLDTLDNNAEGWRVIACCRSPEGASELNELAAGNADVTVEALEIKRSRGRRAPELMRLPPFCWILFPARRVSSYKLK